MLLLTKKKSFTANDWESLLQFLSLGFIFNIHAFIHSGGIHSIFINNIIVLIAPFAMYYRVVDRSGGRAKTKFRIYS